MTSFTLAYVLLSSLLDIALGSYSLYLPEGLGQQYSSQQQASGSAYWPETEQQQEYDEDGGYRYQQSYQSSYRQQIQSIPYTTSYPTGVYQQLPPSPVSTYQIADRSPLPPPSAVLPGGLPTPSLPIYQLVTIGPEVPVLVRLPNQQTAILPVRTVYSLPGFLERIVQRVQNFYSVYNPLEIPRLNETQPESGESTTPANTPTTSPEKISSSMPTTTTTKAVNDDEVPATSGTTTEAEETTTDSNNIAAETTTTE